MRQKSLDSYTATTTRPRRKRRSREIDREPAGITITPVRGFFMALLFLGVPTLSLGTICFSLLQNNLRLSEKNEELTELATEVRADIDSLGEEIESLQKRAGVQPEETAEEARKATKRTESDDALKGDTLQTDSGNHRGLVNVTTHNSSLGLPVRDSNLANALPPRGGPAQRASALDLLEDAKAKVPALNKALDAAVKPALEEALAEEAAFPDGVPVVKVDISSRFGIRGNPFGGGSYEVHEGTDFVGNVGDIIAATADGKVVLSGYNGGYGITVTIDHGYGYETLYAHMSETKVNVGDVVKRGQIIGYIGSTGRSSGPHLHYSIYKDKKAMDPEKLMKLTEETALADGPR